MKSILTIVIIFVTVCCSAENTTPGVAGKKYIFNYDIQLQKCDAIGTLLGNPELIPQGSSFRITHIPSGGYVIVLYEYTLPETSSSSYTLQLNKRTRLNFLTNPGLNAKSSITKQDDNLIHFFLSNADYISSTSEAAKRGQWSYGTLIEPFKFRRNPSLFTSDFSLGAVVGWQGYIHNSKSWTWGFYGGLSLSKVTLDSLSTNNKIKVNSERPAFTPSINLLLGYNSTFSITAGIGWDFINKTSDIEKSWVYNGTYWFGIGIGVKLFTPNSGGSTTDVKQSQSK